MAETFAKRKFTFFCFLVSFSSWRALPGNLNLKKHYYGITAIKVVLKWLGESPLASLLFPAKEDEREDFLLLSPKPFSVD